MNKEIVELREVINKLIPMLAGKHIKVTQRGAEARVEVDPKTKRPVSVNIPSISDNATHDFVRAIQGFIDHEIAHVLLTDWSIFGENAGVYTEKNKISRLASLHGIMEDTMVEREITKIFPGSAKNIAQVRRHFIEKICKPAIKGAKDAKERAKYLIVPLMRALAGHEEFIEFFDAEKLWDDPFVKDIISKLDKQTIDNLPKLRNTRQTLSASRKLEVALYPADAEPEEEESDQDGDGDGKGKGKKPHTKNSPKASGGKSNASGQAQDDKDDSGSSGGKGDGKNKKDKDDDTSEDQQNADDQTGEDENSSSEDGSQGNGDNDQKDDDGDNDGGQPSDADDESPEEDEDDSPAEGDGEGEEEDEEGEAYQVDVENDDDHDGSSNASNEKAAGGGAVGGGSAKSMFDFKDDDFEKADLSKQISIQLTKDAIEAMKLSDYTVYTRDEDVIEPLSVPTTLNSTFVPKMEEETMSMAGKMQKDIERMMAAKSVSLRIPGKRSGRLQSANLHRLMSNDDRIFARKEEYRSKATAVTLLIDNSGSMSGAKCKTAMIAAFALASTLERCKVPVEVLGFTTGSSYTYNAYASPNGSPDSQVRFNRTIPIIMPIYKSFDERINSTVKSRIAHMAFNQPGMNANVDGESLEYAAIRLSKRREPRKVLMVLSDGAPAGAGNASGHLKAMVDRLQKAGFDMLGIGIMDNSVRHYYPKHVVLNDVQELPGLVMNEIRRILEN